MSKSSMENMFEDQKVVDLLSKLKNTDGGYPSDMLAARRRTYLKQMANVGLGIGIGASVKGGGNGATTTAASKVLEIALITAIVLEAGTAAYLYRDKIANAVKSYFNAPIVQEVSASSGDDGSTGLVLSEVVGTPTITASETPSGTPSALPLTSPLATTVSGENNENSAIMNNSDSTEVNTNTSVNAHATPSPQGNNGNHYGQTPQPERTKENNGGGGGNTSDGGGGGNNGGGGGNNNGDGGGNNNSGGNNGRP